MLVLLFNKNTSLIFVNLRKYGHCENEINSFHYDQIYEA